MDWAKPKAAAARLVLADSGAAEMAFFLALSLVPFVGISIALVSRWIPLDLSASIEEVLRGVLPTESHADVGEVVRWARSSTSQGWLTAGFLFALWTSFRFMSLCVRALGTTIASNVAPPAQGWRGVARSLLLLLVWSVALVATACFLFVAPAIERGLLRLPALADLPLSAFVALRACLSAGVLFGAIFLTYRVVAGRRVGALRLALAALLAALGWIGASLGFSRVVPVLWSATQLYGTLGSVVLLLIWAYLNSWILLLGGFLLVRPGAARVAQPPSSAR
jgi:membrane protein